jgi:hypothetical protein
VAGDVPHDDTEVSRWEWEHVVPVAADTDVMAGHIPRGQLDPLRARKAPG